MQFSYHTKHLAWVYKHELIESGWKEKNEFDFDTIPSNYIHSGSKDSWLSFTKVRLAVMQRLIPPTYITDKLGDNCVPSGFEDEDIRKYALILFVEIQNIT